MSAQERDPLAAQQAREQGEALTAPYTPATNAYQGPPNHGKERNAGPLNPGNQGAEELTA